MNENIRKASEYLEGFRKSFIAGVVAVMNNKPGGEHFEVAATKAMKAIALLTSDEMVECLKAWAWYADDQEFVRWRGFITLRSEHLVDTSLGDVHLAGMASLWGAIADTLYRATMASEGNGLISYEEKTLLTLLNIIKVMCEYGNVPLPERWELGGKTVCFEEVIRRGADEAIDKVVEKLGGWSVYTFEYGGGAQDVIRAITERRIPDRPTGRGWLCKVFAGKGFAGVACETELEGRHVVQVCVSGDVKIPKLSLFAEQ